MDRKKVDKLLVEAVQSGLPGVVAAVAIGGEVAYAGAFGHRDEAAAAPMTVDTIGYLASMTKPLTCAAALQLVERGALALDEPVGAILPELSKPQVLEGFDEQGVPLLRHARREITLRHLLSHTSGFSYEIWNSDIRRYHQTTGRPSIFASANESITVPLICDPGEQWVYGIGIDWVGKMVERASGRRLGDYMRDSLLGPLRMDSTAFDLEEVGRSRVASMSVRRTDGSVVPHAFEFVQEPEFQQGGGGLYGTIPDYMRFLQMVLNRGIFEGRRILSSESVDLMSTNQIGELRVTPMYSAWPEYSNDVDFFPGARNRWSLAFLVNTAQTPEGRSAGSLSWAGLSNCYFWLDLRRKVYGAVMTQLFPFFDSHAVALYRALESAVYQEISQPVATRSEKS